MKEFDFSIKDSYYSQINNTYLAMSSCMRTAEIMFLIYNGVQVVEAGSKFDITRPFIVYPKSMQPEDFLTALTESPWGYELRNAISWAANQSIPPGQVHVVIAEIVNNLIGKSVDRFVNTNDITILFNELFNKRSVMTSGRFTPTGHAVCVCGYRLDDNNQITDLLVDDPYGDYFTNYASQKGNNIWFPLDTFKKLWSGNLHLYIGG